MKSDKPILVGFDGSPEAELALEWAIDEAERRDVAVRIMYAEYPELAYVGWSAATSPYATAPVSESATVLAQAERLCGERDPDLVRTEVTTHTSPAGALIEAAHEASAIVVGSRHLDRFSEFAVGSTSYAVATHAHVPVVVVRYVTDSGAGPEVGRVVVGVDGSEASLDALRFALDEARLMGVGLTAVRAWHSDFYDAQGHGGGAIPEHVEEEVVLPAEATALDQAVAAWTEQYPDVHVRQRLVHGRPAVALSKAALGARLLVVGSRGRGGFTGLLLGSTSHGVLHHATVPVAVVHGS
jgi:nucleotide-binding universal stress UspA family protein